MLLGASLVGAVAILAIQYSAGKNEFARYIKSLDLIRHSATRHYEDSQWETFLYWSEPTAKISWWDPTDQLDATYTRNSGETWVMAKHERGYLFLKNFHH